MGNIGLPLDYNGTGNVGVVKSSIPPTPGTKVDYQLTLYKDVNQIVFVENNVGELHPRNGLDGVTGDIKRIDVNPQGVIAFYIKPLPLNVRSISEITSNYSRYSLLNLASDSRINTVGDINGNEFDGYLYVAYGEWRLKHNNPTVENYNNLLKTTNTPVPMTIYYDA